MAGFARVQFSKGGNRKQILLVFGVTASHLALNQENLGSNPRTPTMEMRRHCIAGRVNHCDHEKPFSYRVDPDTNTRYHINKCCHCGQEIEISYKQYYEVAKPEHGPFAPYKGQFAGGCR